ncbi:hypothetical protein [Microbacterium phyllosphaerae]|uniref:hypothetical protein n=1 Tax=Microbacterium phyllosphaerae TaxID=124798 RepID=UPI0021690AA0|nr:hypothetical protein [Microbacterium phyllosphaerae]MCS3444470.1 HD-GYP domain-containing protein (c-di-GMP phosphodiesterase class II) [Microbacterium phyllosphaerae]
MTSATIQLVAPTQAERKLLGFADLLTAFVERRIARRAEKRVLALDLLREQQTRRQDPRVVDHMLAQVGLSRR